MFQSLFKRAERSIDTVVTKFVDRAMVTAPLVVAGGFATAAATVKLVELYGHVTAYGVMAAVFAMIGLVTMAVLSASNGRSSSAETATPEPEQENVSEETAETPSDMDLSALLTPEVRSILTSTAPMALPGIARVLGKNFPLLLILAVVGFIISRFAEPDAKTTGDTEEEALPDDAPATDPAAATEPAAAA